MKTTAKTLIATLLLGAFTVPALAAYDGDTELSYIRFIKDINMMKMMDKNADHKVNKTEFMKFSETMFTKLDKNKDGVIDEAEWTAAN